MYKNIKKKWLQSFKNLYGTLNLNLAEKIIDYLIIKNCIIFDCELWNFFLNINLINHFNINICFIIGKYGNNKEEFIKKLFYSFPYIYSYDDVFVYDIMKVENESFICDYKDIFFFNNTNRKSYKNNIKKNKVNINKSNFPFKIYKVLKIDKKYNHLTKLKNLSIHNSNKLNHLKYIKKEKTNNNDKKNIIKDNIEIEYKKNISSSNDSVISFELLYLNKNKNGRNINKINNLTYRKKILYPYYFYILEKENILTNIPNRKMIKNIDMFNTNFEYMLIVCTKIAIVKQIIWKKNIFNLLLLFFNIKKSQKKRIFFKKYKYLIKKNVILNLFNGGMSFFLIKNLDYINKLPYLKKICIILIILKYIFLWKKMNLNIHLFISVSTDSNNEYNNINACLNDNAVISLFKSYINNFFVFLFPSYYDIKERKKFLQYLYEKHNIRNKKKKINMIAKITLNFSRNELVQLFKNEYRERIINLIKKNNINITNTKCLENLIQNNNKSNIKKHYFLKVLNIQTNSDLFIQSNDIEILKKKKLKTFYKCLKENKYGFNEIIGENKLIKKLKNIVHIFNNIHNENIQKLVTILIYGKTGSGKTFISKKMIEECNCNAIIINCSNIFNKIMGESEKILNNIFDYAINKEPCIILFDNIESICFEENENCDKFYKRIKLCFYQNIDKLYFEKKWKNNYNSILIIANTTFINIIDKKFKHICKDNIYKTKDFEYWNNQDILELFKKCLINNNMKTNVLCSNDFEKFLNIHIFQKKKYLSPLYIINLCRDAVSYRLNKMINEKKNEIINELKAEDFYESVKKIK